MDNNDILISFRSALDINNTDMAAIFKLGGAELTEEEIRKMLIKSKGSYHNEVDHHDQIEEKGTSIIKSAVMNSQAIS